MINPKLLELYNNVNPKVESITKEQLQELVKKLEELDNMIDPGTGGH